MKKKGEKFERKGRSGTKGLTNGRGQVRELYKVGVKNTSAEERIRTGVDLTRGKRKS